MKLAELVGIWILALNVIYMWGDYLRRRLQIKRTLRQRRLFQQWQEERRGPTILNFEEVEKLH